VPYRLIDKLYVRWDKAFVRRTNSLWLIPNARDRKGGKHSYAEWAHVIGLFQGLIYEATGDDEGADILDIGCGAGLLGIAAKPFTCDGGSYTGIDVNKKSIAFCTHQYRLQNYHFIHFDIANSVYAPNQASEKKTWPVDSSEYDVVTALSVWTHLDSQDASFYLREVARVLRPQGKAIISFFVIDDRYREALEKRNSEKSSYHAARKDRWIFDRAVSGTDGFYWPSWASVPENAIGIEVETLNQLLDDAGLMVEAHHQGTWKERPGLYFQDILVLVKK
jgi:SAM-dependent methyltransferase